MIQVRSVRIFMGLVWGAGGFAAAVYSHQQQIPAGVAIPLAAAFLVELTLYFALGFESLRGRATQLGNALPWWLAASGLLPFLIYTTGAGRLRLAALGVLTAAVLAVVFWFRVLPRAPVADLAFLCLMAGVYLAKPFRDWYPDAMDGLRADSLGQLMWIRLGLSAVLLFRPQENAGFGFLPLRREWLEGLRYYLYLLPTAAAAVVALRFGEFRVAEDLWWKAPATFIGILWVVALAEEYFFRGLLMQWLTAWTGATAGLLLSSAAFGLVHLPFRDFPNWKFAALAALAGVFYGLAFRAGGGIRAAMVTHALTVTTWRALLG